MTDIEFSSSQTTALVIIDMQKAYFKHGELSRQSRKLSSACNRLITAFRGTHSPIFFIRTAHTRAGDTWTLNMKDDEQGYLFDGTDDTEFLDAIDKDESDVSITKLRDSAFHATIFEQVLSEYKIDTLVIAGVSAQTCVGQTAADAYARNFRVVLVDDAIGTHDEKYREPTLAMLAKEYRQSRLNVADIIKLLEPESVKVVDV